MLSKILLLALGSRDLSQAEKKISVVIVSKFKKLTHSNSLGIILEKEVIWKCALKFVVFNEKKKSERFRWFMMLKIDFESQISALFDSLTLLQFSEFGNFIWLQLIFSQKPF